MKHTRHAYIYKIKSVKKKKAVVYVTHITRHCGSTTEMKLTPHN
jgi:hypothetical protein